MKLLKLFLKNFKGIRHFELDTKGGNVNIFGDNECGKTTINDAYNWLLFGKDSQGKADFNIKTLDENNNPIHGLEHEVEGLFDVNGSKLTLRRVYTEKWTKKRGSITSELTGHTTNYYINGVTEKQRTYEDTVAEIADSNLFKLLSNPLFFNQLHWEKRRQLLLDVCGDITDEDVIASNKSLEPLNSILDGRQLEKHLKYIKDRKSDLNKDIEKIPVRIDEVNRSLPDVKGLDAEEIQNKLDINQHFIEERQEEIVRIENGGEVAEKTKKLRELQGELLELKNELRKETDAKIVEKRRELDEAREHVQSLKAEIGSHKNKISFHDETIARYEAELKELRAKWHEVSGKQFEFEQDDTCPSCGQALPAEKLEVAKEKALAKFNLDKSKEIEKIDSDGKTKKGKLGEVKSEKAILETKIEVAEKDLADEEKGLNSIIATINSLQTEVDDVNNNPILIRKSQEISQLEEVIAKLKVSTNERVLNIRNEIVRLKLEAEELKASRAKIERHEEGQKRIEELNLQHKKLAREYEKLEHELYLCEEFIRTKVAMLDSKINCRFKYARFKMFDVQVNGGVVPCCEVLYKGVPYQDLNTAAEINIGIDIINTLSEHYGFDAPIFIDNAESVTKLAEAKGQMICLVVSKDDKTLRTEVI